MVGHTYASLSAQRGLNRVIGDYVVTYLFNRAASGGCWGDFVEIRWMWADVVDMLDGLVLGEV